MNVSVPTIRLERGENPRQQPHVLVVRGDGDDKEWEVEHPEACPRVCRWWPDARKVVEDEMRMFAERGWPPLSKVEEYDCFVEYEIVNAGLDSLGLELADHVEGIEFGDGLEGWRMLAPGRYVIEGWFQPFSWAGSEPIDADSGISLVGREGEV